MSESRVRVVDADAGRAERVAALLDFIDVNPRIIGSVDEIDRQRQRPSDWLAIVVWRDRGRARMVRFRRRAAARTAAPSRCCCSLSTTAAAPSASACTTRAAGRWIFRSSTASSANCCAAPASARWRRGRAPHRAAGRADRRQRGRTLPVMIAMVVLHLSFDVLSRAAPQLNPI